MASEQKARLCMCVCLSVHLDGKREERGILSGYERKRPAVNGSLCPDSFRIQSKLALRDLTGWQHDPTAPGEELCPRMMTWGSSPGLVLFLSQLTCSGKSKRPAEYVMVQG